MTVNTHHQITCQEIQLQTPDAILKGDLCIPQNPTGIVLFAHGAGSSRQSPRNKFVAEILQQENFATLLMDLLSDDEDRRDTFTGELRFDIPMLAKRVDIAIKWLLNDNRTAMLPIGCFGASTGAAAALVASIKFPDTISAIVSRGGRPDLADNFLQEVTAPTLLIVGSQDPQVLELNQMALKKLKSRKKLVIVPGATHLFEEPGKLDEAAQHAKTWFLQHLK